MDSKRKKLSRREFLNWFSIKAPVATATAKSFFSFTAISAFAKKTWAQYVPHGNWKNRTQVGSIWTWGSNSIGQLGNSSTVNASSSPIHIGALVKYSDIAMSDSDTNNTHALAVRDDGTLWSWGFNNGGQLGHSSVTNRSSPQQVGALNDWAKVYAARVRSYAIKTDGTLWAWGDNASGQVGNGTTTSVTSPIQIGSDTNWSNLAVCMTHNLALRTNGTMWAWGENSAGQLADGTTSNRSSPVQIGGDTNWSKIAVTNLASMAIKTDGTLWFWGRDAALRPQNYWTPQQVGSLTNWSKIAAGTSRSVAIKTDGTLWTWGSGVNGAMGLGPTINAAYSPTQIGADTNWSKISVTNANGYAIKTTGTLWAWGDNSLYTVGDLTNTHRSSPVQVGVATNWTEVTSIGSTLAHAIKADGTLWAWGFLLAPYAGSNLNAYVSSPVQIGADTDWSKICAGSVHVVAMKSTGTLWSWGDNDFGQLGQNMAFHTPVQKTATNDWAQVSSGELYVMAIKTNGTLWAWGRGIYGQMGTGAGGYAYSPTQVGAATWNKVVASGIFTMGIQSNGTMWAIGGINTSGELGNPAWGTGRNTPAQLGAHTDWTDLSLGYTYTLAVRSGMLWAWGSQGNGAMGFGDTAARNSPVQVGSLTDWSQVSTFYTWDTRSSAAIKTDGTLWTWGDNSSGQLGDGTLVAKLSPIQVGTDTNWSKISSGPNRFHAIKTTGTLWGWGSANQRSLGISSANLSSPTQIGTDTNWAQVTGSFINMGAIKTTGTLWMAGGAGPRMGLGPSVYSSGDYVLTQVGTDTDWSQVSLGTAVYGLKTTNQLWGWGDNNKGELLVNQGFPAQIGTDSDWASFSGFGLHNLAVKTGGTLWGWGRNSEGQLGNSATFGIKCFSPVQIGTETNWTRAYAVPHRSMGLRGTGLLYAWANFNSFGQLGDNTNSGKTSPVQVGAATDWTEISGASDHSLGIRSPGTLWAWGSNALGQLGLFNGSPVQIGTATDWAEISLGSSNEYAVGVKTNGSLWSWGVNHSGWLGLNDSTQRTSPVQVGALTNWSKVSSANRYTLAIKTDGTLWSWGMGSNGSTGLGTTATRSSPVQVGVFSGWTKVVAGQNTAIAKK